MRTAFLAKFVTSFSLSFMNGPLGREILVFLKVRLTLNLALLKMNMVINKVIVSNAQKMNTGE